MTKGVQRHRYFEVCKNTPLMGHKQSWMNPLGEVVVSPSLKILNTKNLS